LFIDLGTARRLVTVVASGLGREGLVFVLSLLLILLGFGSGSELVTTRESESVTSFRGMISLGGHHNDLQRTRGRERVQRWNSETDLVGNRTLILRVESLVRLFLSLLETGSTLGLLVSLSDVSSTGVSFVLRDGRHVDGKLVK
jgi:hypothetical protein